MVLPAFIRCPPITSSPGLPLSSVAYPTRCFALTIRDKSSANLGHTAARRPASRPTTDLAARIRHQEQRHADRRSIRSSAPEVAFSGQGKVRATLTVSSLQCVDLKRTSYVTAPKASVRADASPAWQPYEAILSVQHRADLKGLRVSVRGHPRATRVRGHHLSDRFKVGSQRAISLRVTKPSLLRDAPSVRACRPVQSAISRTILRMRSQLFSQRPRWRPSIQRRAPPRACISTFSLLLALVRGVFACLVLILCRHHRSLLNLLSSSVVSKNIRHGTTK